MPGSQRTTSTLHSATVLSPLSVICCALVVCNDTVQWHRSCVHQYTACLMAVIHILISECYNCCFYVFQVQQQFYAITAEFAVLRTSDNC